MNATRKKEVTELVKQLLQISARVETMHENEKDADARSFLEAAESDIDRAIRYMQNAVSGEQA